MGFSGNSKVPAQHHTNTTCSNKCTETGDVFEGLQSWFQVHVELR